MLCIHLVYEYYDFYKDVGLIVELNALELMMFFGALHRMLLDSIKERMKTLVKLLEISSIHQRIGTMRYNNVVGLICKYRWDDTGPKSINALCQKYHDTVHHCLKVSEAGTITR